MSSALHCIHTCTDLHTQLTAFTLFLVIIAIPISLFHTWDHLTNFRKPKLQSQIVRIAWLVNNLSIGIHQLQIITEATFVPIGAGVLL